MFVGEANVSRVRRTVIMLAIGIGLSLLFVWWFSHEDEYADYDEEETEAVFRAAKRVARSEPRSFDRPYVDPPAPNRENATEILDQLEREMGWRE